MTVQALYDYITKQMTPEAALLKMLEAGVIKYEKLKFDEAEGPVHPLMVIAMAAHDLGWQIAVKADDDENNFIGVCIGTEAYMDEVLKGE